MKQYSCELTEDEIATILAALRFYQESMLGNQIVQLNGIQEIATNGGKYAPLDNEGIQRIIMKLNQGDFLLESGEEWPNYARCENCGFQDDFEEFVPTDGRTHLICPQCRSSDCFEADDPE